MKEQVDKGVFPGAVTLIARRGEIVHFEAHGFQDAAKTKAMSKDAIFRLASMTKPVTTVAAMMLVEQGVIKLNDPIATLYTELKDLRVDAQETAHDETAASTAAPLARPITVQDLMRHTSGFFLRRWMGSKHLKEAYEKANIEASEQPIAQRRHAHDGLGQIPLAHQPGTRFHYSISTDILGFLVERATKKPLDEALGDMLLRATRHEGHGVLGAGRQVRPAWPRSRTTTR